jgi:hypothetical protein
VKSGNLFQTFIHSGEAAIRLVAGHIQKFAFLLARRAYLWWVNYDNSVAAITAFPRIFRNGLFIFCHCRIFSLFAFYKVNTKTVR